MQLTDWVGDWSHTTDTASRRAINAASCDSAENDFLCSVLVDLFCLTAAAAAAAGGEGGGRGITGSDHLSTHSTRVFQ